MPHPKYAKRPSIFLVDRRLIRKQDDETIVRMIDRLQARRPRRYVGRKLKPGKAVEIYGIHAARAMEKA